MDRGGIIGVVKFNMTKKTQPATNDHEKKYKELVQALEAHAQKGASLKKQLLQAIDKAQMKQVVKKIKGIKS